MKKIKKKFFNKKRKKFLIKKKRNLLIIQKNFLKNHVYNNDFLYQDILISKFLKNFLRSGKAFLSFHLYYQLLILSKKFQFNFLFFFYNCILKLRILWIIKSRWRYIKKQKVTKLIKPRYVGYLRSYVIIFNFFKKIIQKEKKRFILNKIIFRHLLLVLLFFNESPIVNQYNFLYDFLHENFSRYSYRYQFLISELNQKPNLFLYKNKKQKKWVKKKGYNYNTKRYLLNFKTNNWTKSRKNP